LRHVLSQLGQGCFGQSFASASCFASLPFRFETCLYHQSSSIIIARLLFLEDSSADRSHRYPVDWTVLQSRPASSFVNLVRMTSESYTRFAQSCQSSIKLNLVPHADQPSLTRKKFEAIIPTEPCIPCLPGEILTYVPNRGLFVVAKSDMLFFPVKPRSQAQP
jgi:hypothetical protein